VLYKVVLVQLVPDMAVVVAEGIGAVPVADIPNQIP
jgi:hypothetical protein